MIFVDSNVPMYLVGGPHPNKDRAAFLLARMAREGQIFVTDVEVYQEIMHRYQALDRAAGIDAAFELLDAIVDQVFVFELTQIRRARQLIESINGLSARDALHLAVMEAAEVSDILSFDRDFDRCPGVNRIG